MYELYLASQTKLNGTEFFEFAPIISVLAYGDAKKAEEMLRNQTYGRWEVVSAASEASGEEPTENSAEGEEPAEGGEPAEGEEPAEEDDA